MDAAALGRRLLDYVKVGECALQNLRGFERLALFCEQAESGLLYCALAGAAPYFTLRRPSYPYSFVYRSPCAASSDPRDPSRYFFGCVTNSSNEGIFSWAGVTASSFYLTPSAYSVSFGATAYSSIRALFKHYPELQTQSILLRYAAVLQKKLSSLPRPRTGLSRALSVPLRSLRVQSRRESVEARDEQPGDGNRGARSVSAQQTPLAGIAASFAEEVSKGSGDPSQRRARTPGYESTDRLETDLCRSFSTALAVFLSLPPGEGPYIDVMGEPCKQRADQGAGDVDASLPVLSSALAWGSAIGAPYASLPMLGPETAVAEDMEPPPGVMGLYLQMARSYSLFLGASDAGGRSSADDLARLGKGVVPSAQVSAGRGVMGDSADLADASGSLDLLNPRSSSSSPSSPRLSDSLLPEPASPRVRASFGEVFPPTTVFGFLLTHSTLLSFIASLSKSLRGHEVFLALSAKVRAVLGGRPSAVRFRSMAEASQPGTASLLSASAEQMALAEERVRSTRLGLRAASAILPPIFRIHLIGLKNYGLEYLSPETRSREASARGITPRWAGAYSGELWRISQAYVSGFVEAALQIFTSPVPTARATKSRRHTFAARGLLSRNGSGTLSRLSQQVNLGEALATNSSFSDSFSGTFNVSSGGPAQGAPGEPSRGASRVSFMNPSHNPSGGSSMSPQGQPSVPISQSEPERGGAFSRDLPHAVSLLLSAVCRDVCIAACHSVGPDVDFVAFPEAYALRCADSAAFLQRFAGGVKSALHNYYSTRIGVVAKDDAAKEGKAEQVGGHSGEQQARALTDSALAKIHGLTEVSALIERLESLKDLSQCFHHYQEVQRFLSETEYPFNRSLVRVAQSVTAEILHQLIPEARSRLAAYDSSKPQRIEPAVLRGALYEVDAPFQQLTYSLTTTPTFSAVFEAGGSLVGASLALRNRELASYALRGDDADGLLFDAQMERLSPVLQYHATDALNSAVLGLQGISARPHEVLLALITLRPLLEDRRILLALMPYISGLFESQYGELNQVLRDLESETPAPRSLRDYSGACTRLEYALSRIGSTAALINLLGPSVIRSLCAPADKVPEAPESGTAIGASFGQNGDSVFPYVFQDGVFGNLWSVYFGICALDSQRRAEEFVDMQGRQDSPCDRDKVDASVGLHIPGSSALDGAPEGSRFADSAASISATGFPKPRELRAYVSRSCNAHLSHPSLVWDPATFPSPPRDSTIELVKLRVMCPVFISYVCLAAQLYSSAAARRAELYLQWKTAIEKAAPKAQRKLLDYPVMKITEEGEFLLCDLRDLFDLLDAARLFNSHLSHEREIGQYDVVTARKGGVIPIYDSLERELRSLRNPSLGENPGRYPQAHASNAFRDASQTDGREVREASPRVSFGVAAREERSSFVGAKKVPVPLLQLSKCSRHSSPAGSPRPSISSARSPPLRAQPISGSAERAASIEGNLNGFLTGIFVSPGPASSPLAYPIVGLRLSPAIADLERLAQSVRARQVFQRALQVLEEFRTFRLAAEERKRRAGPLLPNQAAPSPGSALKEAATQPFGSSRGDGGADKDLDSPRATFIHECLASACVPVPLRWVDTQELLALFTKISGATASAGSSANFLSALTNEVNEFVLAYSPIGQRETGQTLSSKLGAALLWEQPGRSTAPSVLQSESSSVRPSCSTVSEFQRVWPVGALFSRISCMQALSLPLYELVPLINTFIHLSRVPEGQRTATHGASLILPLICNSLEHKSNLSFGAGIRVSQAGVSGFGAQVSGALDAPGIARSEAPAFSALCREFERTLVQFKIQLESRISSLCLKLCSLRSLLADASSRFYESYIRVLAGLLSEATSFWLLYLYCLTSSQTYPLLELRVSLSDMKIQISPPLGTLSGVAPEGEENLHDALSHLLTSPAMLAAVNPHVAAQPGSAAKAAVWIRDLLGLKLEDMDWFSKSFTPVTFASSEYASRSSVGTASLPSFPRARVSTSIQELNAREEGPCNGGSYSFEEGQEGFRAGPQGRRESSVSVTPPEAARQTPLLRASPSASTSGLRSRRSFGEGLRISIPEEDAGAPVSSLSPGARRASSIDSPLSGPSAAVMERGSWGSRNSEPTTPLARVYPSSRDVSHADLAAFRSVQGRVAIWLFAILQIPLMIKSFAARLRSQGAPADGGGGFAHCPTPFSREVVNPGSDAAQVASPLSLPLQALRGMGPESQEGRLGGASLHEIYSSIRAVIPLHFLYSREEFTQMFRRNAAIPLLAHAVLANLQQGELSLKGLCERLTEVIDRLPQEKGVGVEVQASGGVSGVVASDSRATKPGVEPQAGQQRETDRSPSRSQPHGGDYSALLANSGLVIPEPARKSSLELHMPFYAPVLSVSRSVALLPSQDDFDRYFFRFLEFKRYLETKEDYVREITCGFYSLNSRPLLASLRGIGTSRVKSSAAPLLRVLEQVLTVCHGALLDTNQRIALYLSYATGERDDPLIFSQASKYYPEIPGALETSSLMRVLNLLRCVYLVQCLRSLYDKINGSSQSLLSHLQRNGLEASSSILSFNVQMPKTWGQLSSQCSVARHILDDARGSLLRYTLAASEVISARFAAFEARFRKESQIHPVALRGVDEFKTINVEDLCAMRAHSARAFLACEDFLSSLERLYLMACLNQELRFLQGLDWSFPAGAACDASPHGASSLRDYSSDLEGLLSSLVRRMTASDFSRVYALVSETLHCWSVLLRASHRLSECKRLPLPDFYRVSGLELERIKAEISELGSRARADASVHSLRQWTVSVLTVYDSTLTAVNGLSKLNYFQWHDLAFIISVISRDKRYRRTIKGAEASMNILGEEEYSAEKRQSDLRRITFEEVLSLEITKYPSAMGRILSQVSVERLAQKEIVEITQAWDGVTGDKILSCIVLYAAALERGVSPLSNVFDAEESSSIDITAYCRDQFVVSVLQKTAEDMTRRLFPGPRGTCFGGAWGSGNLEEDWLGWMPAPRTPPSGSTVPADDAASAEGLDLIFVALSQLSTLRTISSKKHTERLLPLLAKLQKRVRTFLEMVYYFSVFLRRTLLLLRLAFNISHSTFVGTRACAGVDDLLLDCGGLFGGRSSLTPLGPKGSRSSKGVPGSLSTGLSMEPSGQAVPLWKRSQDFEPFFSPRPLPQGGSARPSISPCSASGSQDRQQRGVVAARSGSLLIAQLLSLLRHLAARIRSCASFSEFVGLSVLISQSTVNLLGRGATQGLGPVGAWSARSMAAGASDAGGGSQGYLLSAGRRVSENATGQPSSRSRRQGKSAGLLDLSLPPRRIVGSEPVSSRDCVSEAAPPVLPQHPGTADASAAPSAASMRSSRGEASARGEGVSPLVYPGEDGAAILDDLGGVDGRPADSRSIVVHSSEELVRRAGDSESQGESSTISTGMTVSADGYTESVGSSEFNIWEASIEDLQLDAVVFQKVSEPGEYYSLPGVPAGHACKVSLRNLLIYCNVSAFKLMTRLSAGLNALLLPRRVSAPSSEVEAVLLGVAEALGAAGREAAGVSLFSVAQGASGITSSAKSEALRGMRRGRRGSLFGGDSVGQRARETLTPSVVSSWSRGRAQRLGQAAWGADSPVGGSVGGAVFGLHTPGREFCSRDSRRASSIGQGSSHVSKTAARPWRSETGSLGAAGLLFTSSTHPSVSDSEAELCNHRPFSFFSGESQALFLAHGDLLVPHSEVCDSLVAALLKGDLSGVGPRRQQSLGTITGAPPVGTQVLSGRGQIDRVRAFHSGGPDDRASLSASDATEPYALGLTHSVSASQVAIHPADQTFSSSSEGGPPQFIDCGVFLSFVEQSPLSRKLIPGFRSLVLAGGRIIGVKLSVGERGSRHLESVAFLRWLDPSKVYMFPPPAWPFGLYHPGVCLLASLVLLLDEALKAATLAALRNLRAFFGMSTIADSAASARLAEVGTDTIPYLFFSQLRVTSPLPPGPRIGRAMASQLPLASCVSAGADGVSRMAVTAGDSLDIYFDALPTPAIQAAFELLYCSVLLVPYESSSYEQGDCMHPDDAVAVFYQRIFSMAHCASDCSASYLQLQHQGAEHSRQSEAYVASRLSSLPNAGFKLSLLQALASWYSQRIRDAMAWSSAEYRQLSRKGQPVVVRNLAVGRLLQGSRLHIVNMELFRREPRLAVPGAEGPGVVVPNAFADSLIFKSLRQDPLSYDSLLSYDPDASEVRREAFYLWALSSAVEDVPLPPEAAIWWTSPGGQNISSGEPAGASIAFTLDSGRVWPPAHNQRGRERRCGVHYCHRSPAGITSKTMLVSEDAVGTKGALYTLSGIISLRIQRELFPLSSYVFAEGPGRVTAVVTPKNASLARDADCGPVRLDLLCAAPSYTVAAAGVTFLADYQELHQDGGEAGLAEDIMPPRVQFDNCVNGNLICRAGEPVAGATSLFKSGFSTPVIISPTQAWSMLLDQEDTPFRTADTVDCSDDGDTRGEREGRESLGFVEVPAEFLEFEAKVLDIAYHMQFLREEPRDELREPAVANPQASRAMATSEDAAGEPANQMRSVDSAGDSETAVSVPHVAVASLATRAGRQTRDSLVRMSLDISRVSEATTESQGERVRKFSTKPELLVAERRKSLNLTSAEREGFAMPPPGPPRPATQPQGESALAKVSDNDGILEQAGLKVLRMLLAERFAPIAASWPEEDRTRLRSTIHWFTLDELAAHLRAVFDDVFFVDVCRRLGLSVSGHIALLIGCCMKLFVLSLSTQTQPQKVALLGPIGLGARLIPWAVCAALSRMGIPAQLLLAGEGCLGLKDAWEYVLLEAPDVSGLSEAESRAVIEEALFSVPEGSDAGLISEAGLPPALFRTVIHYISASPEAWKNALDAHAIPTVSLSVLDQNFPVEVFVELAFLNSWVRPTMPQIDLSNVGRARRGDSQDVAALPPADLLAGVAGRRREVEAIISSPGYVRHYLSLRLLQALLEAVPTFSDILIFADGLSQAQQYHLRYLAVKSALSICTTILDVVFSDEALRQCYGALPGAYLFSVVAFSVAWAYSALPMTVVPSPKADSGEGYRITLKTSGIGLSKLDDASAEVVGPSDSRSRLWRLKAPSSRAVRTRGKSGSSRPSKKLEGDAVDNSETRSGRRPGPKFLACIRSSQPSQVQAAQKRGSWMTDSTVSALDGPLELSGRPQQHWVQESPSGFAGGKEGARKWMRHLDTSACSFIMSRLHCGFSSLFDFVPTLAVAKQPDDKRLTVSGLEARFQSWPANPTHAYEEILPETVICLCQLLSSGSIELQHYESGDDELALVQTYIAHSFSAEKAELPRDRAILYLRSLFVDSEVTGCAYAPLQFSDNVQPRLSSLLVSKSSSSLGVLSSVCPNIIQTIPFTQLGSNYYVRAAGRTADGLSVSPGSRLSPESSARQEVVGAGLTVYSYREPAETTLLFDTDSVEGHARPARRPRGQLSVRVRDDLCTRLLSTSVVIGPFRTVELAGSLASQLLSVSFPGTAARLPRSVNDDICAATVRAVTLISKRYCSGSMGDVMKTVIAFLAHAIHLAERFYENEVLTRLLAASLPGRPGDRLPGSKEQRRDLPTGAPGLKVQYVILGWVLTLFHFAANEAAKAECNVGEGAREDLGKAARMSGVDIAWAAGSAALTSQTSVDGASDGREGLGEVEPRSFQSSLSARRELEGLLCQAIGYLESKLVHILPSEQLTDLARYYSAVASRSLFEALGDTSVVVFSPPCGSFFVPIACRAWDGTRMDPLIARGNPIIRGAIPVGMSHALSDLRSAREASEETSQLPLLRYLSLRETCDAVYGREDSATLELLAADPRNDVSWLALADYADPEFAGLYPSTLESVQLFPVARKDLSLPRAGSPTQARTNEFTSPLVPPLALPGRAGAPRAPSLASKASSPSSPGKRRGQAKEAVVSDIAVLSTSDMQLLSFGAFSKLASRFTDLLAEQDPNAALPPIAHYAYKKYLYSSTVSHLYQLSQGPVISLRTEVRPSTLCDPHLRGSYIALSEPGFNNFDALFLATQIRGLNAPLLATRVPGSDAVRVLSRVMILALLRAAFSRELSVVFVDSSISSDPGALRLLASILRDGYSPGVFSSLEPYRLYEIVRALLALLFDPQMERYNEELRELEEVISAPPERRRDEADVDAKPSDSGLGSAKEGEEALLDSICALYLDYARCGSSLGFEQALVSARFGVSRRRLSHGVSARLRFVKRTPMGLYLLQSFTALLTAPLEVLSARGTQTSLSSLVRVVVDVPLGGPAHKALLQEHPSLLAGRSAISSGPFARLAFLEDMFVTLMKKECPEQLVELLPDGLVRGLAAAFFRMARHVAQRDGSESNAASNSRPSEGQAGFVGFNDLCFQYFASHATVAEFCATFHRVCLYKQILCTQRLSSRRNALVQLETMRETSQQAMSDCRQLTQSLQNCQLRIQNTRTEIDRLRGLISSMAAHLQVSRMDHKEATEKLQEALAQDALFQTASSTLRRQMMRIRDHQLQVSAILFASSWNVSKPFEAHFSMACLHLLACRQPALSPAASRAETARERGRPSGSQASARPPTSREAQPRSEAVSARGEALRPEMFKRRVANYEKFLADILSVTPDAVVTSRHHAEIVDHLNGAVEALMGSRHDQDDWMVTYGELKKSIVAGGPPRSSRTVSSTQPSQRSESDDPRPSRLRASRVLGASSVNPSPRDSTRQPSGIVQGILQGLPGFASRDSSSYILSTDLLRSFSSRVRQQHPLAEMLFWTVAEQLQLCQQWIEAAPLRRAIAEHRKRLREVNSDIEETQREMQRLSEKLSEAEAQLALSEAEAARISAEIESVSARISGTMGILDSIGSIRAQWGNDCCALEANLTALVGDSFMIAFAFTLLTAFSPQERGHHLLRLSSLLRDELSVPLSQVWMERFDIDSRITLQLIAREDLMALQHMALSGGLINARARFTEGDAVLALTSPSIPLYPPQGGDPAAEPLPPLAEDEWTSLLNAFGSYCGLEACVIEHGKQMVDTTIIFGALAGLFSTRASAIVMWDSCREGAGIAPKRMLGRKMAEMFARTGVAHWLVPQKSGKPFHLPLVFSNLEKADWFYREFQLPFIAELQAAPGEISFLDAKLADLTSQLEDCMAPSVLDVGSSGPAGPRVYLQIPLAISWPLEDISDLHDLCRGAYTRRDGIHHYQLAERSRDIADMDALEAILVEASHPIKPTVLTEMAASVAEGRDQLEALSSPGRIRPADESPAEPSAIYGVMDQACLEEANAFLSQLVEQPTLSFMTVLPLPSWRNFLISSRTENAVAEREAQLSDPSFNSFGDESSVSEDAAPVRGSDGACSPAADIHRLVLGSGRDSGSPQPAGLGLDPQPPLSSRRPTRGEIRRREEAEARLARSSHILKMLRAKGRATSLVTAEIAEYTCHVFQAMYSLSLTQNAMLELVTRDGSSQFSAAISQVNSQMRRVAFLLARLKRHMLLSIQAPEEEASAPREGP